MPTALILGGYGLIGSACARALKAHGFRVIGLGRSKTAAMAVDPDGDWIFRDLANLGAEGWAEVLDGVDVVVNASGALQNGPRDDLEAIHATMPERLCKAASARLRLVQISAAGVSPDASTEFFRSKARGDAYVQGSRGDWVILRPTLVISSDAYGGTALLRGAAALPCILPMVLPDARVQTVHIDDLARAVVEAASGRIPARTIADITEDGAQSLPDLMEKIRRWQGFADAAIRLRVPGPILALAGHLADAAGRLGWRSPLRSTALAALREGVSGDPTTWRAVGGSPCRELDATLAALPATRQERLYARLYFALPLAIAILSVFWLASGLLAFVSPAAAAAHLSGSAMPGWMISALVYGGAVADIGLGSAILWRPWCRRAALGMVALASAYLVSGAVLAPQLWGDPLGPMVKVLPSIVLALIVWLGVEER